MACFAGNAQTTQNRKSAVLFGNVGASASSARQSYHTSTSSTTMLGSVASRPRDLDGGLNSSSANMSRSPLGVIASTASASAVSLLSPSSSGAGESRTCDDNVSQMLPICEEFTVRLRQAEPASHSPVQQQPCRLERPCERTSPASSAALSVVNLGFPFRFQPFQRHRSFACDRPSMAF